MTAATSMSAFPSATAGLVSVSDYHAMIADGTLGEDDPVELIEGVLVFKMPKNKPHRIATTQLNRWLSKCLPSDWVTQTQDPLAIARSEPEPDITCVAASSVLTADPHPAAKDVGLLIEVSDSSLLYDRTTKLRLYASNGIVEYWIVNLVDRQIEVHTQPRGEGYASRIVRTSGEQIALPATLGGAAIDVAALLPPA